MPEPPQNREGLLRALLAHHDEPCPACGYNLRGLTGEACPECGEALRLRVGMVEPRMRLFLAGLIGLACGVGFDGIVLAWYVWTQVWGSGREADYAVVLVLGLTTCGGAMLAWLRARGWIRCRSPIVRAALVAGCWLVAAGAGFSFFAVAS